MGSKAGRRHLPGGVVWRILDEIWSPSLGCLVPKGGIDPIAGRLSGLPPVRSVHTERTGVPLCSASLGASQILGIR